MSLMEQAKSTATQAANDPMIAGWVGKLLAGSSVLAYLTENASNIMVAIGLVMGICVSFVAFKNQQLINKKLKIELETAELKRAEARADAEL